MLLDVILSKCMLKNTILVQVYGCLEPFSKIVLLILAVNFIDRRNQSIYPEKTTDKLYPPEGRMNMA